MESAKVLLEVLAGVIPNHPEEGLCQRWGITTKQWEESTDQMALLAEYVERATDHARTLMMRPDKVNWVQVNWVWL